MDPPEYGPLNLRYPGTIVLGFRGTDGQLRVEVGGTMFPYADLSMSIKCMECIQCKADIMPTTDPLCALPGALKSS